MSLCRYSFHTWISLALIGTVWLGMVYSKEMDNQTMEQMFTHAVLGTFGVNDILTANNVSRMIDSCGKVMDFTTFNKVRTYFRKFL